ncbi:ArnT family glycosyltransferase [Thauera sp. Sel9]|uniref:ArnT family glycosyltransferase n=1 Tax=Thauera sp. Sel9 TaxID=2974299 RepID=UPI0021E1126E|nr:glycosyltransferase family 39 protein [Thauera sp. Sel9]MCV2219779.1 glycosyltransferase family 39 protein [Thauera sp. Sel9]
MPDSPRRPTTGFGLFWLLCAILGLRLLTMAVLPMSDTTEPRYAETARLMAERGDWITPWFTPDLPFWGKPPLSFWAQAASLKLFGVHDFAARLPSWLAMIGILWLTLRLARQQGSERLAWWSGLVLASMALPFISAGAVLTDPFLAFGTTLSLVSLALAVRGRPIPWGWLFFVGLAIGLLAKGPLALVLVGLPGSVWLLCSGRWRRALAALPWKGGSLLVAALVLPWYAAAELKTPGFLDYFLVGEHFRRFVDPGWAGDLYGNAHRQPYGTIWLFLLWASFPWGIAGLALLVHRLCSQTGRTRLRKALADEDVRLLLVAGFAPAVFFSVAGNILWTYLLPGLPFLAILIARGLQPLLDATPVRRTALALVLAVPLTLSAAGVHLALHPYKLKSAAPLIAALETLPGGSVERLYYLDDMPFSARYYSRDAARRIERADLLPMLTQATEPLFVAVRRRDLDWLEQAAAHRLTVRFRGAQHILLQYNPPTPH